MTAHGRLVVNFHDEECPLGGFTSVAFATRTRDGSDLPYVGEATASTLARAHEHAERALRAAMRRAGV